MWQLRRCISTAPRPKSSIHTRRVITARHRDTACACSVSCPRHVLTRPRPPSRPLPRCRQNTQSCDAPLSPLSACSQPDGHKSSANHNAWGSWQFVRGHDPNRLNTECRSNAVQRRVPACAPGAGEAGCCCSWPALVAHNSTTRCALTRNRVSRPHTPNTHARTHSRAIQAASTLRPTRVARRPRRNTSTRTTTARRLTGITPSTGPQRQTGALTPGCHQE
jgi:hypothetical protein